MEQEYSRNIAEQAGMAAQCPLPRVRAAGAGVCLTRRVARVDVRSARVYERSYAERVAELGCVVQRPRAVVSRCVHVCALANQILQHPEAAFRTRKVNRIEVLNRHLLYMAGKGNGSEETGIEEREEAKENERGERLSDACGAHAEMRVTPTSAGRMHPQRHNASAKTCRPLAGAALAVGAPCFGRRGARPP